MAHLTKSVVIDAPVDVVYTTARNPSRWPTWFVGMGELERLNGEGETGTVAEFGYMLAGVRFAVVHETLIDNFGPEGALWAGKFSGPLAGEHTWTYTPTPVGTEVHVEMAYTVPGAALGKVADRLIVERMQERALEQSLQNLKMLSETET